MYLYIVNACTESAEKVIPQRQPERSKDQKKAKHILVFMREWNLIQSMP